MRTAIGVIAIAAGLSACNSAGLPALGSSQRFGYPIERASLPPLPAAPASQQVSSSAPVPQSIPVAPVQIQPSQPSPAPIAAELPVYDDSKDPYVTAVLLPPVDSKTFSDELVGPDGQRTALPPMAKIEIINVSENMKVLTSANP